jgi:2-oxoisovalerate dehydrogenase E1 component
VLVALDQLVNQAANVHYVSRGELNAALVVRMQQGATPGSCAQHSQSLEALFAHIPGLRVGLPATPQDAYSMLRAAVACPDPCVLIEARALYTDKGSVRLGGEVEPLGGARLRREGHDAGIITWGSAAPRVMTAAEMLLGEGIRVSVLDLRWLSPLDDVSIANLVRASRGRVMVVHEANRTGGFGAEIAARISERHLSELEAPVRRLATPDVRIPAAPSLQRALLPTTEAIAADVRELVTRSAALL